MTKPPMPYIAYDKVLFIDIDHARVSWSYDGEHWISHHFGSPEKADYAARLMKKCAEDARNEHSLLLQNISEILESVCVWLGLAVIGSTVLGVGCLIILGLR